MERRAAPRIAAALVTIGFGIYMVGTIAAVQASLNVYATDVSGVLQLSGVAGGMLAAGLIALSLQNLDHLWLSIIELVLYGYAFLSAMAGVDSDVFLHRPVSLFWLLMIWVALCFVFYLWRVVLQWRQAGQEMVDARAERLARAEAREAQNEGITVDLPEWEDTSLPPPRL